LAAWPAPLNRAAWPRRVTPDSRSPLLRLLEVRAKGRGRRVEPEVRKVIQVIIAAISVEVRNLARFDCCVSAKPIADATPAAAEHENGGFYFLLYLPTRLLALHSH
jgi:hypothetical protein